MKDIFILGIESSCDETAAAILRNNTELSNIIADQNLIHKYYGGVVPELASRAHQKKIVPVVEEALHHANITKNDLDAIAFTRGPGLMGSLLVGVSFAKSMAMGLEIPLIEVNHMQGHVLSHFISKPDEMKRIPSFPFLCLIVSGGHTQIVQVNDYLSMNILGETLDDAAGEAFDKTAKILGLPYPGGPLIDKYAAQGNPERFSFPVPQIPDLNFSFSGLKTAILYFIQKETLKDSLFIHNNMNDICASVQNAIIKILLLKLKKAILLTGIKDLALAGGVSANSGLRNAFMNMEQTENCNCFIPRFEYCTDNAAMIGITGYYKFRNKEFSGLEITPLARMPF